MAQPLGSVGRYELLEVIGRGGAAVVYLARQPDLDRKVALKELAAHHAAEPSFAQRFVEESRLAAAMNHPSIVTVYEYFEHAELPYIAMEYMSQGSLRSHLGRLSGAQLGGVLESVLDGLRYAEQLGIVHRDLKPENLLVGVNGEVKIADFGVARALSSTTTRQYATVAGTPIGTPAYMAPEQAMGTTVTFAADLYSVGIIAWEALAGRTPFGHCDTPMVVLYQQVHEPIPPIESIRDDVHPGVSRWLARMLAKRPEDRFPSAEEAWNELEEVLIEMLGPRWRRGAALVGLDAAPELSTAPETVDPFAGAQRPQPEGFRIAGLDEEGDRGGAAGVAEPAAEDDGEEERRAEDEHRRAQLSAVLTPEPESRPSPTLDPFIPFTPPPVDEPVTADGPDTADEPVTADLAGVGAVVGVNTAEHSGAAVAATGPRGRATRAARRTAAAGAVVLAAAAGGVIGAVSSDNRPVPVKPPVTTTSAAQLRALAVRPTLSLLASESAAAIARFQRAKYSEQQAPAALTVSENYRDAEKQLHRLPAGIRSQPAVSAVIHDVAGLASDWYRMAHDAAHDLRRAFAVAARVTAAADRKLRSDATAAESAAS